jgi:hypothetical protein
MELKQASSAQPETHHITTAKASGPPPAVPDGEEAVITDPSNPKSEPFAFADFTCLTGNARTKDTPYATKFFTPEIRSDVNYTYDFRHPQDDTISGSSEIFRANEVQVTQLGVGGDFHYDNVRARLMTQFGLYSETTPRNDASSARGQWNLADAYRYVSEAYGGYHFNIQHGVNVDAGIFMSYVGLFSYYQFDNWAYQPSYVSSNTPWFFNGVRVQWFPTAKLKIEPWFINGWQSYGRFNNRPGLGGQILWRPNGNWSIVGNQYGYGEDALGIPSRTRYHTDDSVQYKYYQSTKSIISMAAATLTFDAGCESGGGVSCHGNTKEGPKQSFLGFMAYNRLWFDRQPRPLPCTAATDQWSNGCLRNTVLHRKSGRHIQGVGRFGYDRLHAQPILHLPPGVQPPRVERSILQRPRRRHSPGRQHRSPRLFRARLGPGPSLQ